MKLALILSLFTLNVMVKSNLIAVAQPMILALGTIFTAINHQDSFDKQPIEWKNFMPFAKPKYPKGKKEPRLSNRGRNYIDSFNEYQEKLHDMSSDEQDAALEALKEKFD